MIQWVNKEEALYKYPVSKFSEIEEVSNAIEPFLRLFQVVFKWQRAEKKSVGIMKLVVYNRCVILNDSIHSFQPISTYFNLFQPISTYFNLFQPISTYFNLFQPISTYFNLFQPISTYLTITPFSHSPHSPSIRNFVVP